jgi:glycerol kinase
MADKYILAIDQGTSSSRAFIISGDGKVLGKSQREFSQFYPAAGWVEHDPLEIWSTVKATALAAIADARISATDIAGIGITNQRETIVVWERATGKPVYNAIVWQSRQSADVCLELKNAGYESFIRERTGLVLDPYFSASKITWLFRHKPELLKRAQIGELCCGTIDAWLIWQLSGGQYHHTDVSNASRTMLLNLATGEWDSELCELFTIPMAMLPKVLPSAGFFGETAIEHFGVRIPILGAAGDQQAALFGQSCIKPGMVKCTFGTGAFVLMNTGGLCSHSQSGLLTTVAWKTNEELSYALEGSVFMSGATVAWLRDNLGMLESSRQIEQLASQVEHSDGVVVVPAFVGLGAPYWDSEARGCILGLNRGSTKAHVARATLEAMALQAAEVIDCMAKDAAVKPSVIRVDGGAAANSLLMQMLSDFSGIPVIRPAFLETTVLGAAFLAMLAAGIIPNKIQSDESHFEPFANRVDLAEVRERWIKAVEVCRWFGTGARNSFR